MPAGPLTAAPRPAAPLFQIAPPAGARPSSQELPPFETVSSPYLHTSVETYTVQIAPRAVYAYYLPRLQHQGYRPSGEGTSGSFAKGITGWDWSFSRGAGMQDTLLLTVEAQGSGSRYSVARELIVAPPRPAASIVPRDVQEVVVSARASMNEPWVTSTLRSPQAWRGILKVVNALPVDTGGRHSCTADLGAAAEVRFVGASQSYAFSEDPACDTVTGPAGAQLQDEGFGLWTTVTRLVGLPTQSAP